MNDVLILACRWASGFGGVASFYRSLAAEDGFRGRLHEVGKAPGSSGVLRRSVGALADIFGFILRLVREKPRVIVLNPSMQSNAIIRDAVYLLIAKFVGCRVVVFWHGWNQSTYRKVIQGAAKWWFRAIYSRAAGHLVLASSIRSELCSLLPSARVALFKTAVDDSWVRYFARVRSTMPSQTCDLRILFISRLEEGKGALETVGAAEILGGHGGKVRFCIAGAGALEPEISKRVALLPDKSVRFLGRIEGRRKKAAFRWANVLIFPSSYGEGLPVVILEGLAAGCVVVTTSVGGIADFFEAGTMGFVLDETRPEGIAAAIRRLLSNVDRFSEIRRFNQQLACDVFSASIVRGELLEAVQALSNGAMPGDICFTGPAE